MPWTYATLTQAIIDWSENPETTMENNLPNIVRMAELRIAETVLVPVLRKTVVGVFIAGDPSFSLPTDFLSPYAMLGNDRASVTFPIHNKEGEFLRAAYPDPNYRGQPRYSAVSASLAGLPTGYVAPTPDWAYPYSWTYFSRPVSIVDNSTSYIGTNAEDVLFFACMRNASVFMKGETDMTSTYDSMYLEAVANFKLTGQGRQRKDWFRKPDRRIEAAPQVAPTTPASQGGQYGI